jgi:hypothetical protein
VLANITHHRKGVANKILEAKEKERTLKDKDTERETKRLKRFVISLRSHHPHVELRIRPCSAPVDRLTAILSQSQVHQALAPTLSLVRPAALARNPTRLLHRRGLVLAIGAASDVCRKRNPFRRNQRLEGGREIVMTSERARGECPLEVNPYQQVKYLRA